ncbi:MULTISPECIES: iron-sulfur cluster assembly protein [unclassified Bradyrhizobium]|uniref:iron-sulfur cluster assembly protein n=1 Tax=unclassified Bradyrhizobium TaxID=2631580 RepID=UPI0029163412|nr:MULTISPECIES: iron-sulfur cluster assembly protein [unclassified Bradyrhizobium]
MGSVQHDDQRAGEVWARLALVTDPELDEPVTELGFVERVAVDNAGGVDIDFRLPTFWCAANFAFLMADDMHHAVLGLSWVRQVRLRLEDHMVAAEINRGVALGLSFQEALREFAPGESLEQLRQTFRRKAFQRRQEAVIVAIRDAGHDEQSITEMNVKQFDGVTLNGIAARQKERYRELLVERGFAGNPEARAFVTWAGQRIEAGEFAAYLRKLRGVRINMEFNTALCRGLLGARYRQADEEAGQTASADAPHCGGCGAGCGKPHGGQAGTAASSGAAVDRIGSLPVDA